MECAVPSVLVWYRRKSLCMSREITTTCGYIFFLCDKCIAVLNYTINECPKFDMYCLLLLIKLYISNPSITEW
jgi:hypothetical protein